MTADRFREFFAAANEGHDPYPWQVRLVERIAATGSWPAAITAPTGSGKSSVVDIHVFLVAERARARASGQVESVEAIARPPRRLVLVAPRRVLVDDQFERATRLAGLLAGAGDGSLLAGVREALASLLTVSDAFASPLIVTRLRGGTTLDLAWRLDPSACQVICATPQMWGSRLLMRGYRASARSRNLETGLMTGDATVVIDEAHLHERLVDTATRVAALSRAMGPQIVAMSATRTAIDGHGLAEDDRADPSLVRRISASKSISVLEIDDWESRGPAALAEHALQARRERPDDGTVGVFANTVQRALDAVARLQKEDGLNVRLVCGRMRPVDLDRLRETCDGLLGPRGCRDVDILVSTQSLEVGVDLDLGTIVSDVAPAAALAQRVGRLNRSGARTASRFVVLAPTVAGPAPPETPFGPYTCGEIEAARAWLVALDGDGCPQRIAAAGLPATTSIPIPPITAVELRTLAMTSHALAADVEPSFYIEDPCERRRREVQICARRHLQLSEGTVRQMLRAVPPMTGELATLALPAGRLSGRSVLEKALDAAEHPWVVRFEGGEQIARPLADLDGVAGLVDGDVVVVEHGLRVLSAGVIGPPSATARPLDDVSAVAMPDGPPAPPVVLELDPEPATVVEQLVADDRVLGTRRSRNALADLVAPLDPQLASRLRRHRYLADLSITWAWAGDDEPGLLIVVQALRGGESDRSVPERAIALDAHCLAVAERMKEIIDALDGLVDERAQALRTVALLHDEGKRHPRFQARMGRDDCSPALAKPRPGHVPDRGDGWRHEQLSAAVGWARTGDPLITTLVAAHHGAGRPLFDRDAVALMDGWDFDGDFAVAGAVDQLFGPAGTYERLRASVQTEHGAHRLTYLEALVRCADAQVSREEAFDGGGV